MPWFEDSRTQVQLAFFLHNFPDCVDLSHDDLSRCKKLFRPAIVAAFTFYPNPPPDLNKKLLLIKMLLQTFKVDANGRPVP